MYGQNAICYFAWVKIGIGPKVYGARRRFADVPVPGVHFVPLKVIPFRRLVAIHSIFNSFAQGITVYFPTRSIDCFHSFNGIVLNRVPWIVSFESLMPRMWLKATGQGRFFARLARDDCRAILASSKNALLHMKTRNAQFDSLDRVLEKTKVAYPGVEDFPDLYEKHAVRLKGGATKLIFIGNMFFAKGGTIALNVFERLKSDFEIRLTVVSNLDETNPFSFPEAGTRRAWKSRMDSLGVKHLQNLNFREVREEIADSDFLILPSFDESFSFCSVEALSCGVLPIATRMRALPEIVEDERTGFLVDVPTTEEGRCTLDPDTPKKLEDSFYERLAEVLQRKSDFKVMRRAARERFLKKFSQERLARDLKQIYETVL